VVCLLSNVHLRRLQVVSRAQGDAVGCAPMALCAGSLEVGDLETDVTAAPLAYEFQGVTGWVHEGAAVRRPPCVPVRANTVDALAEGGCQAPRVAYPMVAGEGWGTGPCGCVDLKLRREGWRARGGLRGTCWEGPDWECWCLLWGCRSKRLSRDRR